MTIKSKKENEKLIVYIDGSIDTSTSPSLLDFLQKEMHALKELELDFSKVEYVSSAGLRVLLFAQKTMSSQGKMVLSHVNSDVKEVFDLTCFTDILTII